MKEKTFKFEKRYCVNCKNFTINEKCLVTGFALFHNSIVKEIDLDMIQWFSGKDQLVHSFLVDEIETKCPHIKELKLGIKLIEI